MNKNGIDISEYQGDINFEELKGNIDFAMVRTSIGNFREDRKYKQNISGLESTGVPYGVYHYSYATTVEDAVKEAELCYSLIKNKKLEYPVAYDMEENRVCALGKEKISQIAKAFCEKMESYGYYVCIYSNKHWFENFFTDEIFKKYDIWLAQWTDKPTFKKPYGIWQKSSKGRVDGIDTNVDLSAEIKRLTEIFERDDLNFKEFDDCVIRRITECIRVMGDKSIIITLKGGFELREKI